MICNLAQYVAEQERMCYRMAWTFDLDTPQRNAWEWLAAELAKVRKTHQRHCAQCDR